MSTTLFTQDSEPLDLYEIALLLNYERASTEPRFRHAKLCEVANEEVNFQTIALKHDVWDRRPAAKTGFVFDISPPKGTSSTSTGKGKQRGSSNAGVDDGAEPDLPSNMLPNPVPLQLQFYSQKELETIYWQARGHDGCFVCISLLQAFFDLYSSDTPLRVRTLNDDYVTKTSTRAILEMDFIGPKSMTLVALFPTNQVLTTGESSSMPHSVMVFGRSKEGNIETVLDMASMQFGDHGRGLNGRSTFVLESLDAWYDRVEKVAYSADTENGKTSARIQGTPNPAWLERIARRVKERWEKRETEPWCGHCGLPNSLKEMKKCSNCQKAWYCDDVHQKAAWPLHKRFCSKGLI